MCVNKTTQVRGGGVNGDPAAPSWSVGPYQVNQTCPSEADVSPQSGSERFHDHGVQFLVSAAGYRPQASLAAISITHPNLRRCFTAL